MREPPPLHGTIIGNGLVVLLTPAYEASADFGNSFALWANTSSSLHPQAAPSSALSSSRSEEWRTPTLHFGSVSVSPSVQRLLSGIVLVPAIMSSICASRHYSNTTMDNQTVRTRSPSTRRGRATVVHETKKKSSSRLLLIHSSAWLRLSPKYSFIGAISGLQH
ncbi:hypothetical protein PC129_g6941 [Phytophthora cactorum]|uniref:Uncharacterized protein n=1 Tax=Phytophthora cactorum TaxID=29920 RepID=A0A8T1ICW6_9STRA|nr:hypothetical protein PC129_g6941 [Phytophthora cactorum]